jgi:predicted dehydrogenase
MREPLRVAIVGTGGIARIHARDLATAAGGGVSGDGVTRDGVTRDGGAPAARLVAVMDVDEGRLGPFGREFGVSGTYLRLEDLLRRERPDLVHVCTPPSAHRDAALAALRAGSSVLVEKPPAISLREFDEMAAADGGDDGPWLATVFQHRFGSGQRRLKALAAAGVLGRPLLAVCHTTWYRPQAYFDVPWRGRWDTEGGGPTMGHGIHQMDMLLDVLGEWTSVSATARTQARAIATEDLSLAYVTFASGAVASVVNSVLSPREESYLRFDFERATVEVTHLYGYGDAGWRLTPLPGHADEIGKAWADAEHGTPSGHAAQFRHVLSALADGRRPPVGPAGARATLSLVAGIYASSFTGSPVSPGDLAPGTPFHAAMNGAR